MRSFARFLFNCVLLTVLAAIVLSAWSYSSAPKSTMVYCDVVTTNGLDQQKCLIDNVIFNK